ncbi:MAG: hypothetical protein Sylvanvirus3_37 [Sylvanvirus sp.]|uniref:Uncharacterized protein n=1 Tax=Sylvanvirus sp. TaxID=2487774 RepID=A0A3G5AK82_9VIRU|nr:MAG: hypothetical protein Sylvanvirus3_37 [Sylvanvirus sp.]
MNQPTINSSIPYIENSFNNLSHPSHHQFIYHSLPSSSFSNPHSNVPLTSQSLPDLRMVSESLMLLWQCYIETSKQQWFLNQQIVFNQKPQNLPEPLYETTSPVLLTSPSAVPICTRTELSNLNDVRNMSMDVNELKELKELRKLKDECNEKHIKYEEEINKNAVLTVEIDNLKELLILESTKYEKDTAHWKSVSITSNETSNNIVLQAHARIRDLEQEIEVMKQSNQQWRSEVQKSSTDALAFCNTAKQEQQKLIDMKVAMKIQFDQLQAATKLSESTHKKLEAARGEIKELKALKDEQLKEVEDLLKQMKVSMTTSNLQQEAKHESELLALKTHLASVIREKSQVEEANRKLAELCEGHAVEDQMMEILQSGPSSSEKVQAFASVSNAEREILLCASNKSDRDLKWSLFQYLSLRSLGLKYLQQIEHQHVTEICELQQVNKELTDCLLKYCLSLENESSESTESAESATSDSTQTDNHLQLKLECSEYSGPCTRCLIQDALNKNARAKNQFYESQVNRYQFALQDAECGIYKYIKNTYHAQRYLITIIAKYFQSDTKLPVSLKDQVGSLYLKAYKLHNTREERHSLDVSFLDISLLLK